MVRLTTDRWRFAQTLPVRRTIVRHADKDVKVSAEALLIMQMGVADDEFLGTAEPRNHVGFRSYGAKPSALDAIRTHYWSRVVVARVE